MAGVTLTGFVAKTVADLRADLNANVRTVYGLAANVDPRSRIGQLIGIFAAALSEAWELAEAVAGALDPLGASGVLLDNLCALTGTFRQAAASSSATITAIGTAGTVLATARRASVTGTSTVFETTAGGTITAAAAWAALTAYAAGATRTASGSVWRATNAGSSSSTAPNGAGPLFVDGTVTWRRLGAGSAFVDLPAVATVTGPLQGFTGSISTIDTPVAGWASVTNAADAVPGRDLETDAELRVRRRQEIAKIGTSTLGALRAEVAGVAGVSFAAVFENPTDVTVGTIGPHGVEVIVEGGDDATIAQAILDGKAAGIATFGTTLSPRSTTNGDMIDIRFTRPALVDVWVTAAVTKNPALYPANGDDLVRAALVEWGDARELGRDVVASAIAAQIFASVPGVLDVTSVLIGLANPPVSSASLVMTIRQRANFDTGRTVINSVNGSP
jgi:uncharacterized phage protein gp47/JayE